jgi:hypothetical protein
MSFRSRHSQPSGIIAQPEAIFMGFRGPEALLNLHGCPQCRSNARWNFAKQPQILPLRKAQGQDDSAVGERNVRGFGLWEFRRQLGSHLKCQG